MEDQVASAPDAAGAGAGAGSGMSMADLLVLHFISLLLGLVIVVFGTRVPQLLALVSSAGVGLWMGLVVQEGLTLHHAIFGVYQPTDPREPLTFCIVFTVLTGVLSYFARRVSLSLLTAVMFMLNAVTLMRVVNMSPAAVSAVDSMKFHTFVVVAVLVLSVTFGVAALVVFRLKWRQVVIGFNAAQLGMLLILSALSQIVQRLGASPVTFSILGDLARTMAQPRGSLCEPIWSGQQAVESLPPNDVRKVCHCGILCRTEILAWIIGSWGLMALRRICCRRSRTEPSPRSRQHRPLPREEELPPPTVLGATDGSSTPPALRGSQLGDWRAGGRSSRRSGPSDFSSDDGWEDPHAKLRKLREWLEEGLISLGDFETKKRELLGRM